MFTFKFSIVIIFKNCILFLSDLTNLLDLPREEPDDEHVVKHKNTF